MAKRLLLLSTLVVLVLFTANAAFATVTKGDTLVIQQADQDVTPWNEIVAGDTTADGSRVHSVYELEADGWYPMSTELVAGTYDLNVVGGKRSAGQARPVVLAADPFGSWWMLTGGQNVTVKGIHMQQCQETPGGNIGPWARAGLQLTGVDSKVTVHDCIWDFTTGFSMMLNKNGLDFELTNTLLRFSKPLDNSVWAGQGLDMSAATLGDVLIQNCTWYGGGPFMLKTWESTENSFKMDHCTIVDFVQWPIHGVHWVNAEFTNNVFYNAYTMGEDSAQVKGQDPEELPFGVINVDTLFIDSLGVVDAAAEAARSLAVKNNNNFTSQVIKDYWAICTADPVTYHEFRATDPAIDDGFMNSRTIAMFADDATWPGLVHENTTSLDPEFADYFDYADTLVAYSKKYYDYAWPGAKATTFMRDPDGEPLMPTDPMVYNMKVGNATLRTAATDGGPIGDLTWELADGYNSTQAQIGSISTGVTQTSAIKSDDFMLQQNYPNPFNPTTTINFALDQAYNAKLTVYNMMGQEVAVLLNDKVSAGSYSVAFDGANLTSGVYFYRLEAGDISIQKKMILIK